MQLSDGTIGIESLIRLDWDDEGLNAADAPIDAEVMTRS